jgi:hypothetical protein
VTVSPNGTDKIGGVNTSVGLSFEGQSVTLVYVDSTQGWINTMDSTSNVRGNLFVAATGGTILTCGDYKVHTFTGPGTFTVTSAGNPLGSDTVDYLVVAGGGGGDRGYSNRAAAGGGGAGGYRASGYGPSPLQGLASSVSIQGYPITVGAGGTQNCASNGSNSIFAGITSAGGGYGFGGENLPTNGGGPGGSGGGGDYSETAGSGNTPPVSPPQGNAGGIGNCGPTPADPSSVYPAGGGGGAMAVGGDGPGASSGQVGGAGGAGAPNAITGSATFYAGGGGGGVGRPCAVRTGGPGGNGGGGRGAPGVSGGAGTANTGGGGGGGSPQPPSAGPGGNGGSGIVIIRYKFQ